ncbi:PAS domain S-box protein [Herpetosiphon llansteffanensis]|uniref:PAS domain S-box protein n=1 Tax=Herpetosiphon llansteffanensis TaxID=2094568 RepID=UPI000D7C4D42|nr:PAS domain S-box protein [Herpetosiphon llansteffanensis]
MASGISHSTLNNIRLKRILRFGIFTMIVGLIMAIPYGLEAVRVPSWQNYMSLISIVVATIGGLCATISAKQGWLIAGAYSLIIAIAVATFPSQLFIAEFGFMLSILNVFFVLVISIQTLPERHIFPVILGIISLGVIATLLKTFLNIQEVRVSGNQEIYMPVMAIAAILILIFFVFREFGTLSIRNKILISFVLVTTLPIAIISFITLRSTRTSLTNQANSLILVNATNIANEIDDFVNRNINRVSALSRIPELSEYLLAAEQNTLVPDQDRDTRNLFRAVTTENNDTLSVALLNNRGIVLVDTVPTNVGVNDSGLSYYQNAIRTGQSIISPVTFGNDNLPSIYFSTPVRNPQSQEIIGVLRIRYSASIIQSLVARSNDRAGQNSFGVVLDEYGMRIAQGSELTLLYKIADNLQPDEIKRLQDERRLQNINAANLLVPYPALINAIKGVVLDPQSTGQVITIPSSVAEDQKPGDPDPEGNDIYAYTATKTVQWRVLYHQSESTFLAPIRQSERSTTLIVLVLLVGISMIAVFAARILTTPIERLTAFVERFRAGDLSTRAPVTSQDEIGQLTTTFNSMSEQLAQTLQGLQQRTIALETSNEVSRRLSTILNPNQLVLEVVEQLKNTFNYYHAHIYLVDQQTNDFVMMGGTGQAGRTLLARNHRIPQGRGLVGRAASTKDVVLIPDVSKEAGWLANPLLPETKAEIAVPIMLGDEVLGVLDVQNAEVNSLTNDDATLLQSIAAQVAVGLENAQSFEEINRTQELLRIRERAITASNDGIVIVDPYQFDMPVVYVNPAFERITGYTPEDVLGKNCRFLQGDDGDQPGLRELRHAIREKRATRVLLRNYRKDGTLFWNELDINPVFDDKGELINFIGVQQDVSERVEAQQALQESLGFQQTMLDSANYMIIATTLDGKITSFNRTAEQMLGYDAHEVIGKNLFELANDPAEIAQFTNDLSKQTGTMLSTHDALVYEAQRGRPSNTEWTYVARDGRRFPVLLSITALRDRQGQVTGYLKIANDISAAKQQQQALRDSETRYRSLAESSRDLVFIFDRENRLQYINDFAAKIFDKKPEELMGLLDDQIFLPSTVETRREDAEAVFTTGQGRTRESMLTLNGEETWFDFQLLPILDDQTNSPELIMSVGRNITDRKRDEQERERTLLEIDRQRRTLQGILEALPVGVVVYNAQFEMQLRNQSAELIVGQPLGDVDSEQLQVIGETYKLFIPGTDTPFDPNKIPVFRALQHGERGQAEFDIQHADGRRFTVLASGAPVFNNEGQVISGIALLQDITDRKLNEQERERLLQATIEQERLLKAILDNMPIGVYVVNNKGVSQLINRSTIEILGVSGQMGAAVLDQADLPRPKFLHESTDKELEVHETGLFKALTSKKVTHELVDVMRFDGSRVSVDSTSVPMFDENQQLTGVLSLIQDVTEQRNAQREREQLLTQVEYRALELETVAQVSTSAAGLLNVEELLQTVVDLTKHRFGLYHAHIYLYNPDDQQLELAFGAGEIGRTMVKEGRTIPLDREQSLVAQAGRARRSIIENDVRSNPSFLPHPLLPETRAEMATPLIAGSMLLGVLDIQSDKDHIFTDDDRKIQTTLASQIAIALQNARLFVEQTATMQRLQELDQLKSAFLANMSHELRTPLNSILGFTEVILEGINGPINDLIHNDLSIIHRNGRHLLNLINDILDMAKIESGKLTLFRETFDVVEVLHEVASTVGPLATQKHLELKVDIEPHLKLPVYADRFRIRQVLLNIVGNALKFTEQGSVIIGIDTTPTTRMIKIQDTGIGIPLDNQDTIFMEFHQVDNSTTRKAGGTGLGLPISRHLVEMHGGKLSMVSTGNPGEGSLFTIELPINASEDEVDPNEAPANQPMSVE